ncbi:arf-GAP with coiled-coil, ANK repeat and PH domain-containing protein 2 [Menidia menidia]
MDLFDDLPEPTQTPGPPLAAVPNTNEEERVEDRRARRRPAPGPPPTAPGGGKKVCREVLRGLVACRRGEREEMQDAHVLLPDLIPGGGRSRVSYFAVFDGHGGSRASRFAAENLHLNLVQRFPSGDPEHLDKLVRRCLLDSFRQTDEDFLKKASSQKPFWKDGCTATVLLVVGDVLYVASLGDSRAVLCRTEVAPDGGRRALTLALSKEHNPTIYEERMRIQRAGGTVRDGRVLGLLDVSRSIGDGQFKRCGVISTPEIRSCRLTASDRFVLLACDGLFKVFSAHEANQFVLQRLKEGDGVDPGVAVGDGVDPGVAVGDGVDPGVAVGDGVGGEGGEERLEAAVQQLASEAVRRGCADNVTVILVSVGGGGGHILTSDPSPDPHQDLVSADVMDSLLDFEDCIRDSPEFRLSLDQCEEEVSVLGTKLDKVRTPSGGEAMWADGGGGAGLQLSQSEVPQRPGRAVPPPTAGTPVIMGCLDQFHLGLQELLSFHTMLLDQTQRAIRQQLASLVSQFLPPLAEARRDLLRIGGDLEAAAARSAQAPPNRPIEAQRADHLLLATRKCHQHFALDYCLKLNTFRTQQKMDILNSVFSFVHAQFTFFHQGFDLLRDLEPTMKTMAAQLSQLSADCSVKKKELENQHLLVQQRDASGESVVGGGPDGLIQGFLFKQSRRKSRTWKRCWFSLRDNQLTYRKSHKQDPCVLFEDLRLCGVKSVDQPDRRFCFQLLSVQRTLPPLPPAGPPPPSQRPAGGGAALGVALAPAGNRRCCDCEEAEPRWAAVNLGVTICIQCSGIHRSLGVHVSKVRSLTLDSWEPEQLKLLSILGNDVINGIYEARRAEEGRVKPNATSPRAEKEAFIREKYVEKRFLQLSQSGEADSGRLHRAAAAGDLVAMATALAEGAKVNQEDEEGAGRTPLMAAAAGDSLSVCELLLLNGANVNQRDGSGRGPLHAAAAAGRTGQVCLLLRRGANQYAADEKGQDPLAIAVETAHADIVTLLRMARMNEEMRDSEGAFGATGDDETFQDIIRDFSDMASHDPDRLSRRRFSGEEPGGGPASE